MAAGIGEASAILAVAQLGISLSNSLISYIGEVRDAPFRIQRISNEVATTCERLKDIGDLVEKNQQTNIFSQEGINSAVRCSEECSKIIEDVKAVLRKGGKDDIDPSVFSTLRWPFLKRTLDVPRAELQRIKIDLSLLFSSAMALGASTSSDKVRYTQDIPGLQRTRDWAARMADQARQRERDRYGDSLQRENLLDEYWMNDEPELLEGFVAYQERRIREEEDKKAKERALLLQAEQEAKRKKEEEARHEIETKAIEAYQKQQDELKARTAQEKDIFRNELSRVGLQLDQIELILNNSNLNFGGNGIGTNVPRMRPKFPHNGSSESATTRGQAESDGDTNGKATRTTRKGRMRFPWRRIRKTDEDEPREPSLDFLLSNSSSAANNSVAIETWLLDSFSNTRAEIMPSAEWLEKKFGKQNKNPDVWRCFAGLKPLWRNAILDFLRFRNLKEDIDWSLYHIELPQRHSRMGLGHKHDDQLIQVIIVKREDFEKSEQARATNGPRPIKSYSDMEGRQARDHPSITQSNAHPYPKVSFADETDEKLTAKPTAISAHQPLPYRNEDEMRDAIKRLGAKKEKLDDTERERIDEINDMILLLAAQLELHDTLSPSQRKTLYGDSDQNEASGTIMRPRPSNMSKNPERHKPASGATDQTEEIFVPRDHRNRPLGSVDTMHDGFTRRYSVTGDGEPNEQNDVYHGRYGSRENDNTPTSFDYPRSRSRLPLRQKYAPPIPAGELVARQTSPRKRSRSFERSRQRRRPRERYPSPEREEVTVRRSNREAPSRDKDEIWHEYPGERERHFSPYRDEGIIIRRDHRDSPRYEREDIIIRERDERLMDLREKAEGLKWKREEATRNRDYATNNDLTYNAIPDLQGQISELEAQGSRRRPTRRVSDYALEDETRGQYPLRLHPTVTRTSTLEDPKWPGAESKALILRTGGSRQAPEYMEERILDRSIRVRGEQDNLRSPEEYAHIKRLQTPIESRQNSYTERDRPYVSRRPTLEPDWADIGLYAPFDTRGPSGAHLEHSHRRPRHRNLERLRNQHRRPRRTISSGSDEDDEYIPIHSRDNSKSPTRLSDQEVIANTLRRFTTFQGDQPPTTTGTPPADKSSGRVDDNTMDRKQRSPAPGTAAIRGSSQAGGGLDLGTTPGEPSAKLNGYGPQPSPQAPYYPSPYIFLPPPAFQPEYTDAVPEPSRKPRAATDVRGYDVEIPVSPYNPPHYSHQNADAVHTSTSPNAGQGQQNQDQNNFWSNGTSQPEFKRNAGENGQVNSTREPRITEVSDESSEGGRRRIRKEDRKATVEDFEPHLEAGKWDPKVDDLK